VITFVTPTYNHEKYIERCIKSILEQTVPCEQVIIDDGSKDKTGEIAKSFESSSIRYIHQENKGIRRLAETYNSALSHARGDSIAILEGDDFAAPKRAEAQEKVLTSQPVSWGLVQRVSDTGQMLDIRPENPSEYEDMPRENFIARMLKGCYIPAITVTIKKTALESLGGFIQGDYYVDYPTWLALLTKYDFYFINQVLSYWGVHPDSYSSTLGPNAKIWNDSIKAYDTYRELRVIPRNELIRYWWTFRMRQKLRLVKSIMNK
jgi:glycosyltransferase involved in cell wall biosynthesis